VAAWVFLGAVLPVQCAARNGYRQNPKAWEGEWGSFVRVSSAKGTSSLGRGLSISDCKAERCDFSVKVQEKTDYGNASGYVDIQSATSAIVHLIAFNEEHCTLALELAATEEAIEVKPRSGDCTYFLTPGASFEHRYPLHSRDHYVGEDVPACFLSSTPARQALCTSQALADQVKDWLLLYLRVAELDSQPDELTHGRNARDEIVAGCNRASDVGSCLQIGFAKSTQQLEARQSVWLASVTDSGDPARAESEAQAIRGSYRHSFRNGDVDGDHFTSTDRLDIAPLSDHTIRFSVDLQFYNGHECSIDGIAKFAKPGFFVFQDKDEDAGPLGCVLEIIPGKAGVTLADPTGGCKRISCGERGGYGGAAFSFKDRR
jgi:hypothetical protein